MKQNITIDGVGKVTLDDTSYIGAGGEANVFVKDDLAVKIYHDPSRMIPLDKIKELSLIQNPLVLRPKHIVYDSSGKSIGYAMDYIKNTHPVCKLFTRAFKQRNGISNEDINDFVEQIQQMDRDIHAAKCLIVDHNEMNLLATLRTKKKPLTPYAIDVDSFQTISHKASAIMESIRDPLVKNNKWTEESDWFSFAIITFQLFVNIHPFKGSHPDYKPSDWLKRMKEGISVFNKDVKIPSVCNSFDVIPASHLEWYKDIFVNNKRYAPPPMGDIGMAITIPTTFHIMSSNASFTTDLMGECPENILNIFNFMGIPYYICANNIYKAKMPLPVDIKGYDQILVCESSSITPVVCKRKDKKVDFETEKGVYIGSITANDMMYRNGCIYTVANEKLIENSFAQFGEKVLHATKQVGNVLDLSTKVFDGVIFQDLLGKIHITLPYEKGKCKIQHIVELDGYRILDARSERNIVGVMAEKSGSYHRFIFTFSSDYLTYKVRVSNDVQYADINLTILPNGVGVLATDTEVEIFKDEGVKVINNPPFNSATKIYNVSGGVCYFDGKRVYSTKMKK